MKETLRPVAVLTGICLIVAVLLAATNGGTRTLEAPRDYQLIDASAMDDTLAGVFAGCHVMGMDPERAAEIAYAAANLCGSRFGAHFSIPSEEELAELMA